MNPPTRSAFSAAHWSERFGLWGYVLFFAVFGAIMAPRISNIAGGADPSCYLELSRLFMHGRLSEELRPVASLPLETFPPELYAPLSYDPLPDHAGLKPVGFTGMPLLITFFDLMLPTPLAATVAVWLALMASGALLFVLLRELGLGSMWACFGAITLGLSPLAVLIGSLPMTDLLTCSLAALCWWLALRAERTRGRGWALGLGFALGFAVLTRAANVLFFPAIGAVLLLGEWRHVRWGYIVLGGLPAAVFMVVFNLHVHGSPFATGYHGLGSLFHLEHFRASLLFYARWLNILYFPLAISLAPLALLLIGRHTRTVVVSWIWIAVFVGFYAFYYASTENWWILRYLLPGVVAMIVASVLVLRHIETWMIDRWRLLRWRGVLPLVLALATTGYGSFQGNRLRAYDFKRNESNILEIVDWIGASTTHDDVFLCFHFSGSLHYYTDRTFLRQERLDLEGWRTLTAVTRDGRQVYAVLYVFEMGDPDTVAMRFPGQWEQVFQSRDTILRVFRLVTPATQN